MTITVTKKFNLPLWGPVFFTLLSCTHHHYQITDGDHVKLYLEIPDVSEVLFCTSLDSFRCRSLKKSQNNVYWVRVPVQEEFVYFYRVDGKVVVPDCEEKITDDFGAENCFFSSDL